MKMKHIFGIAMLISATFASTGSYAQSDGCSAATAIAITANCSSPVAGTTIGATQTIAGCVGTADDDVWYTFTATSANHIITITPSAGLDPVVQLFSGACSVLISITCMDNGVTGEAETIYASGLTVGAVYTFRVYHYFTGSGTGTFTACVTTAPPAPSNDNCSNATLLNVNATCSSTAGTTVSATQSQAGCAGTSDDDVWYRFVATNAVQTIQVTPSGSMDPVVELFSGTCSALTSITCRDSGFSADTETIQAVGLIPGTTYYVRVYDYYAANGGGNFNICVIGTPTATPTNDNPCTAIAWPPVTASCDYLSFTTTGATTTTTAPTPASCVGGSGTMQGGFQYTPQPKDVWFSITVPSSGVLSIMARPAYGFTDAVMALYSGTCSSLTQIACSDDHNYPGSSNDMRPFMLATGLTPGSTVFLRYWAFSGNTTGDFGLCVSTPTNDACSNALYICDLNGYEGTTNAAYTIDRPSNMRANAEMNNPPTYTYTPGTCQGGIFGLGGAWGTGAPNCDVAINNNSWIRFTAAATMAVLDVDIYDCYVGNYPSGGIQMQVFSAATSCATFTPVSDFKEGSSHLTITANNLSVGQDYYLMIDGFASDICNYSISASSGVQFPDISAADDPICIGESTTLYGPDGASAYHWYPGNQTTQNIIVNPATTMTYMLEVTGVCGHRQLLSYTLDVNQLPTATASSNGPVCEGNSLSLTGSGGASYLWSGPNGFTSTLASPSVSGVTALNAGTYLLTVINASGCSSTSSTTVSVNPNPIANAGSDQTIAFGAFTTLSGSASGGSGSFSYSWTPAASLVNSNIAGPQTQNLTTSTIFTLTVTDLTTGCVSTSQMTVNISGGPLSLSVSATASDVCAGTGVTLNSLASGGTGSYTYTWTSNPAGFSSSQSNPYVVPTGPTTYIVSVYDNNVTVIDSVTVGVWTLPVANASNTGAYCFGSNIQLNASGGTSFQWSGPASYSNGTANPTISPATTVTAGIYTVTVSDSHGCIDTATTDVIVYALPLATAANTGPYCEGETIQLTSGGGSGYVWSGPGGYSEAIPNPTIAGALPSASGSYAVTVTGLGGCTAFASTNITVNALPDITATNNGPYCEGDSILLSAFGGSDYSWTGPGGFTSSSQAPDLSPAQLSQAGTYSVIGTDINGCENSAQTTVLVNPSPDVSISGSDTVCEGELFTLTAAGATNYQWNSGGNAATEMVLAVSSATYVVTGSIGNCIDIDSIAVVVNPSPIADAGSDTLIDSGESVQLEGSGGLVYLWQPPDYLSDPNSANPVCTPEDSMTYVLLVTNQYGCTDTDTVHVRLDLECGSLYVPNAFSPNADGKNDVFGVFNRCLVTIDLKVFNQWGNLVFETNDPLGRWDGTFGNTDAESGIYSYYFKGTLSDETNVDGQGNFVLIR